VGFRGKGGKEVFALGLRVGKTSLALLLFCRMPGKAKGLRP
jgi:hypothetical protein